MEQKNKMEQKKKMLKINEEFYVDKSKSLGKGAFAVVYKGYCLTQGRIVAVKFIDQKMLQQNPDFNRQILVMEDLAKIRHPNIMEYYGYEKNNQGLYCFIQFCSGGTLKQYSAAKISELKVMALFRELLDAMAYISSLKKVHRDLKPENILLDEHLSLKIADFGLARDVNVLMTKGACTPLYAAPEVISLENYNQKCDVWSAGIILYEMLVGKELFSYVTSRTQLVQELNKFAYGRKINYPASLHSKWQDITSMMLVFQKDKRPSFQDVLQKFDEIRPQMEADLIKKYGYQSKQIDEGLKITKSFSPYQSIPMKFGKVDMLKKLKEQRSYTNLNNLRKYLTFFRLKNEFLSKIIKQFTVNVYGSLKNVYKYMLMFLSASTYVSRLEENLSQIKAKKISTPDGPLTQDDFQNIHQEQISSLLKDFSTKNQHSITKFKSVIQKQIITKILGSYMKRPEQKKILQNTNNILKMIEAANQGQFDNDQEYMSVFVKIMDMNEVYLTIKELQTFSSSDVKTYMLIRIIGNMDQVFPSVNYINDDYIRMKKQQFQNMTKKQAIQFIKTINIK